MLDFDARVSGGAPPVLHAFPQGANGAQPVQGLTVGKKGALLGVTYSGGTLNSACAFNNGCGTVFELKR